MTWLRNYIRRWLGIDEFEATVFGITHAHAILSNRICDRLNGLGQQDETLHQRLLKLETPAKTELERLKALKPSKARKAVRK